MQKKYWCQFSAMDFEMPVGDLEKAKVLGRFLKKFMPKGDNEFKNKDSDERVEKNQRNEVRIDI